MTEPKAPAPTETDAARARKVVAFWLYSGSIQTVETQEALIADVAAALTAAREQGRAEALSIARSVAQTYRDRAAEWDAKRDYDRSEQNYERSLGADKVARRIAPPLPAAPTTEE